MSWNIHTWSWKISFSSRISMASSSKKEQSKIRFFNWYWYVINGRKTYNNQCVTLFIDIWNLLTNTWNIMIKIKNCHIFNIGHSVLPPLGSGGEWYLCHQPGRGGQLLNFKSQGGDTFRGEMILGSEAAGELRYHDELFVFPQNASPWILQISPVALS